MQFERYEPHAALQPWVRYYWMLEAPAGFSMEREPIAPDGTFELVVHLATPPEQWSGDRWVRQAVEMLVGEVQRPTLLRSSRRVRCAGVHFAPGGVSAFFDEPATLLVDRMTTLDSIERPWPSLQDELSQAEDGASVSRVFDRVLLGHLRSRAPEPRARRMVEAIEFHHGQMSIERLARHAGVSVRHLERILRPVLGLPPKRFARVVRFHHAFSSLLGGDREGALDGYYDQSHFIRDLREFASAPTRELMASPMTLNRHFHGER